MAVTNITDELLARKKCKIQFIKTTLGIDTIYNRIKKNTCDLKTNCRV